MLCTFLLVAYGSMPRTLWYNDSNFIQSSGRIVITVRNRSNLTKPNFPVIGTRDIESWLTIAVPVMCTGMHAQNCFHDPKAKAAHTNAIIILYSQRVLIQIWKSYEIWNAYSIPIMQYFTGISRYTQSKLFMLLLSECVWVGISKIMHCGILINMPHWPWIGLWNKPTRYEQGLCCLVKSSVQGYKPILWG